MERRNAIEISVKGLVLAVTVVIALGLSAVSLYMVSSSKSRINEGNTQYGQLMGNYSELNATMYDGLCVSGDKVVEVINDFAKTTGNSVAVKTLAGAEAEVYTSSKAYAQTVKSADDYINPTGTFIGSITKNSNGIVTGMTFTQTK